MTSYHVSYKIGSTELYKCCFDIAEAYDAVKDILQHDSSIRCVSLDDMICVLAEMKRGITLSFEAANKLRVSCRRDGGEDAES